MGPRTIVTIILAGVLHTWSCSAPQEVALGGEPSSSSDEAVEGGSAPDGAPPAPDPAPPTLSARPYGASPITETAEALTDAALAALRDEPIPQIPVPTRGSASGPPVVRRRPHDGQVVMPQGEITVLGLFFELEVVLKVAPAGVDQPTEASDGGLEVIVYVGSRGVRIIGLEPRRMGSSPGHALPQGLTGLEQVVADVLERLRAGTTEELFLGEAERALFGPELWREVTRSMPRGEQLERARRLVESVGDVTMTYEIDDSGVIARDEQGTMFMIEFDFDDVDGRIVLDASPLFRIEHRLAGDDL